MSVWLRLNKREAVRKREFCVWASLCAVSFSYMKSPPYCYSTFLYMPSLSPSLFLYFLLACLIVLALLNSYSEKHLDHLTPPFLFFFSPQDASTTRLFPAKLQHKKPCFVATSCSEKYIKLLLYFCCWIFKIVLIHKSGCKSLQHKHCSLTFLFKLIIRTEQLICTLSAIFSPLSTTGSIFSAVNIVNGPNLL